MPRALDALSTESTVTGLGCWRRWIATAGTTRGTCCCAGPDKLARLPGRDWYNPGTFIKCCDADVASGTPSPVLADINLAINTFVVPQPGAVVCASTAAVTHHWYINGISVILKRFPLYFQIRIHHNWLWSKFVKL
jgi:hypothetical protein